MNKPNHTPGPWLAQHTVRDNENRTMILDQDHNAINTDQFSKVGMANAMLLAAAPDALECLIEARAEISRINIAAGETVFNPAITSMIDYAIAKATGEIESVDRAATLAKLQKRLRSVRPDHSEDEGAYEHMGEIQSVIDALQGSDEQIKAAAAWVGLDSDLVVTK
jgi:polygalacturonase